MKMISAKRPDVLFLSVANSARSQMAEGLALAIFGDAAEVRSAGYQPSGSVQPWAVKSMAEIGIDISSHHPKPVADLPADFLAALEFVVTLGEEVACPVLPTTAKRLHWPIPDPAAANEADQPAAFRHAREEIKKRVEYFWEFHRLDEEGL